MIILLALGVVIGIILFFGGPPSGIWEGFKDHN
jgi:hypothetical protein